MSPEREELRGAGGAAWRRLRSLFRRDSGADVDAELAFHLEMREADYRARGLTPDAAHRAATERFGSVRQISHECTQLASRRERAVTRMEQMIDFRQDLRLAVRSLWHRPAFALTAAFALALGIAATLAVWALVDGYLFRPLPLREGKRLVVVAEQSAANTTPSSVWYSNYRDIKSRTDLFDDAVYFDNTMLSLRVGSAEPTVNLFETTSGNYFRAFGVPLFLGRGYTEQEETERARVVVLTHAFWLSRFAGASDVIGKQVQFNGVPFQVIGVAAPGYAGMRQSLLHASGFLPFTTEFALTGGDGNIPADSHGRVAATLKPGVTLAAARAALVTLSAQERQEHANLSPGHRLMIEWETRTRPDIAVSGIIPWAAAIFLVLTGLVLLIGCTNVAGLFLARASARRGEIAVRRALGATTGRMVRLVVTESMVLALLALVFAAPLTWLMLRSFSSIRMETDFPVRFSVEPTWGLLPVALGIAVIAALLTSIAPALHAARLPLQETLKDGGRGGSGGKKRRVARTLLVGAQVAVSFVLLVCAALFARSVQAATTLDLGFRPAGVVMGTSDPEILRYDRPRTERFYRDLLAQARALPGVKSASLSRDIPLGYNNSSHDLYLDHDIGVPDNRIGVGYNVVSPDYFATLGYRLLEGRDFVVRDDSSADRVVVINAQMAKQYWPGASALGRRFRLEKDGAWFTVVGVVGSGRYTFVNESPKPYFYMPMAQRYRSQMTLELLAPGNETAAMLAIRRLVHELDPDMPVGDVRTMQVHLEGGLAFLFPKIAAIVAVAIGLLGLIQAVVGLYGVVAFGVAERTREIGIRIAIGARPGDVVRGVMREGLMLTGVGMLIGVIASLGVAQLTRAILVGVGATDPVAYLAAAVLLLSVTTLAAWLPARRAAATDPTVALREG
ncbi:MAG: ABC transporter permease [Gemmatimonadota bacterium]